MNLSYLDLRKMRENAQIGNNDLNCALDYIEKLLPVVHAAKYFAFIAETQEQKGAGLSVMIDTLTALYGEDLDKC